MDSVLGDMCIEFFISWGGIVRLGVQEKIISRFL